MKGGGFLLRNKTFAAYKNFPRNQPKRSNDPDMENIDYHTYPKSNGQSLMVFIQPGGFIRLNLFVKVEMQKWLDHPFRGHSPANSKIVQGMRF